MDTGVGRRLDGLAVLRLAAGQGHRARRGSFRDDRDPRGRARRDADRWRGDQRRPARRGPRRARLPRGRPAHGVPRRARGGRRLADIPDEAIAAAAAARSLGAPTGTPTPATRGWSPSRGARAGSASRCAGSPAGACGRPGRPWRRRATGDGHDRRPRDRGEADGRRPRRRAGASRSARNGAGAPGRRRETGRDRDLVGSPAPPRARTGRVGRAGGDGRRHAGRADGPDARTIVRIHVDAGAHVREHTPLVILEAMKMEHVIAASAPGRVAARPRRSGRPGAAGPAAGRSRVRRASGRRPRDGRLRRPCPGRSRSSRSGRATASRTRPPRSRPTSSAASSTGSVLPGCA